MTVKQVMILKINKINNEKNEAALPQAIQFTLPIAGDLQTMNFPPLPLPEHCIKRQNSVLPHLTGATKCLVIDRGINQICLDET